MTTNAGSDNTSNFAGFVEDSHVLAANKTEKALSRFLRPEFINRIDEIITFNSLTVENFADIAKIMLRELEEALADKGIKLGIGKGVDQYIAINSFSNKFGARNMRRYIQTEIEDKLAEAIISRYNEGVGIVHISVKADKLVIKCE